MEFDRSRLRLLPLEKRVHDLSLDVILPLKKRESINQSMFKVAGRLKSAKRNNRSILMIAGAHVVRSGTQRYIIDLMQNGYISCLAVNGAFVIHDFEFALIGATTESVRRYIREGQFGLWNETGLINEIVNKAHLQGLGMGEAVGKAIAEGEFPHKDISLLAVGYELGVPITVHVGIGFDIIHEHPNFDGAATGATSYRDFLRLARVVENLEGGMVMSFGSAIMAPEIFLKALAMARNVATQKGNTISDFSTLVCDLHDLPEDVRKEPSKNDVYYYFRPWKTMLSRTVDEGGESFYVRGRHDETIPALWSAINQ